MISTVGYLLLVGILAGGAFLYWKMEQLQRDVEQEQRDENP